jgi:hypothetical protein
MPAMKIVWNVLAVSVLSMSAWPQCQEQKLLASDMEQGDRFGSAVAIQGDWLIVGSPQDDDMGLQSGSAYVFRRNGNGWVEHQKLTASDGQPSDSFGFSVAMDGTTAVIGAPHESPLGSFDAGSAYVFELQSGTWVETVKIWGAPAFSSAHFGDSVSISSDRILIGARDDPQGGFSAGAAYVFDRSGSGWFQTTRLTASDPATGSFFGRAVSLSGDVAAIGSASSGPSGSNQGAAYVFEWNGVQWQQTIKLQAQDGATSDFFGTSVATSNDRILVGSPNHDHVGSNAGATYAFERNGSTWLQVQEFFALDADLQDIFGSAIAIHVGLAVGSAFADEDPIQNCGSVYAFRREAWGWSPLGKLLPLDPVQGKGFGRVAVHGSTVLIGALVDDDACPGNLLCNSGSAYIFELAPDAKQFGHCTSSGVCNNPDPHGGCVNSTGQGANLGACGSSSVVFDELVLEASRLPANTSALIFTGTAQAQVPMGAGYRVVANVGGPLHRFGVQSANANGVLRRGPGLVAASQGFSTGPFLAGDTWNFQCWYRDSSFACVRKTNLSNGVEVLFTP